MSNWILEFFEIDADRARRDRPTIIVSLGIVLAIALVRLSATYVFGAAAVPGSTAGSLFSGIFAAGLLILAMLNITWPARILLPLIVLVTFNLVMINSNAGLNSTLILGFPFSILVGGLLLGRRGSLMLGILAIISIIIIGVMGMVQPEMAESQNTLLDLVSASVLTISVAMFLGVIMRLLFMSIREARENEQKQAIANEELLRLQSELEVRIEEATRQLERRTQDLAAVAEVARDIISIQDTEKLLPTAVDLIRDRFAFYHVSVFLIDESGEYALLRAATGEAGRLLLANRHQLKVGETGIVGYTASSGQPRIASNVGVDAMHFRNPLLPYTRSEIALPLKVGGRLVIGVLDVQSMEEAAFSQDDVDTLQILADQLTIAIENGRLVNRLETALRDATSAYQTQVREGIRALARRKQTSFEYDRIQIAPAYHQLPDSVQEMLRQGKPVTLGPKELKNLKMDEHSQSMLLVPLVLRDQVIGVIGMENTDPNFQWADDQVAIAETIATQAAITLENARLLEESQSRAIQERALGDISARISETIRMENVLRTTAQELSRALGGSEVLIQIQGEPSETATERRTA